ncbi:NUDIX hydrolase [Nitrosomonas sp.]|uniref:NUDIX hydrolase n=1 Tax=Nitrosomonas sp. TaxID=42353 RepID=UPI0025EEC900|nr:NUDIX hydrolase [Nitrosomonas sp.]MBS0587939.1 NUDIX hydrolase [Pseudomonadota bacterium]MBV6447957.1 Phosphatase NudJ [Nitrosomonas sp.]
MTIWKPNVTVAAVIERDGKFLLVEEEPEAGSGLFINQPAGHLDPGESIIQGAIRETLEETAYTFVPEFLVGIYHWHSQRIDTTYIRFAFGGRVTHHDPHRTLDTGILQAAWFSPEEVNQMIQRHRSPLVMQCIRDYQAGKRYPLELLTHYES